MSPRPDHKSHIPSLGFYNRMTLNVCACTVCGRCASCVNNNNNSNIIIFYTCFELNIILITFYDRYQPSGNYLQIEG